MDTNKAAYWIALGVFALALNGEYRHGRFVPLHRVSEFAASALCRMAAHAEQNYYNWFSRIETVPSWFVLVQELLT